VAEAGVAEAGGGRSRWWPKPKKRKSTGKTMIVKLVSLGEKKGWRITKPQRVAIAKPAAYFS